MKEGIRRGALFGGIGMGLIGLATMWAAIFTSTQVAISMGPICLGLMGAGALIVIAANSFRGL